MKIHTENTPNPRTVKFVLPHDILDGDTFDFRNRDAAVQSPLAVQLFTQKDVTGVFLGRNFVSVTIENADDWYLAKPGILGKLMEHFAAKRPVVNVVKDDEDITEDSDIVKQIKELLDTRIRPAVAMDGGDIIYHGYDDGVVYLKMQGACAGCPSSDVTLKIGIENMLKHYIPEVQYVESVEE